MTQELQSTYNRALLAAHSAVIRGDKDQAMFALKAAMRAANKSKDARYRRAVFRALSFTRNIPASTTNV